MTFIGLYMYDRAKLEVARGERKVQKLEFNISEKHLLPLDTSDLKISAPPTPEPFSLTAKPLSATSATETVIDELPRRRSSSFSEVRGSPGVAGAHGGWGLGSIQEITPPITPRVMSPPPMSAKVHRVESKFANGHRRRYSNIQMNGDGGNWSRDAPTNGE